MLLNRLPAVLSALCVSAALHAQPTPNILLVLADDIGADNVGVYGEGTNPPPTPNIDALRGDGVLFRNAWACPVCSPTRASLHTGRYPFRHGVGTAIPAAPPLPMDEVTIPEALDIGNSGYAHAAFGKWHIGGNSLTPDGRLNPNLQGYGHFAGVIAGAFTTPFDYEHWPKVVDGEVFVSSKYATSENVDDALDWIGQQTDPWFCYLAFNAPHTPFHAPPAHLHNQQLPPGDPCQNPLPFYTAMVEAMDTEFGRLLNSMDPATRANTIVIFVGDNGTTGAVATPPFEPDRAKGTMYEGGVNVPLIISGAGITAPGRENAALVHVVDLFATVLELAGVDPSAVVSRELDAVSAAPYLRRRLQPALRDTVFTEVFLGYRGSIMLPTIPIGRNAGNCLFAGARGGITGQTIRNRLGYKLIRSGLGRQELFNLVADPFEENNLYRPIVGPTDPIARQQYDVLSAELDALLGSR